MGNSSFRITSAWNRIDQPVGPILGGTSVQISGAGFSERTGVSYQCHFTEAGVHGPVSAPAYFVSHAALWCTSPPWPHAAVSSLTVTKNGEPLRLVGPQSVLFDFQDVGYWITASPTSGPAEGGNDLTVAGNGFNAAAPDYFVYMYGADAFGTEQVSVAECVPSSSTKLICRLPPWVHGEASVRVELMQGNDLVSKVGATFAYTFTSYWIRIATPTYGGLEGGTRVTIAGNAFFPTAANLRCRWSGETEHEVGPHRSPHFQDTVASITVSIEVECDTPKWMHHEQTVKLSIYSLKGGQENFVLFTGEVHEAEFRYVASWESATTLIMTSRPWPHVTRNFNLAPLRGGSVITIIGAGFDRFRGFDQSCKFTCIGESCGDTSRFVSSHIHVRNSTVMTCNTPPWLFSLGNLASVKTQLSVVHSDGLPLYHDVNDHFYIKFTRASIQEGFTMQGRTSGGAEVTIVGSNVCNQNQLSTCDNAYKCEFREVNDVDRTHF